jgi:hypothetical protein
LERLIREKSILLPTNLKKSMTPTKSLSTLHWLLS